MKKLMFIAVALLGLALAPKSRAGVSFGISIGDDFGFRPEPRYRVATPEYCPPPAPVYVAPPTYYGAPRCDYRWHHRAERWHDRDFRRYRR